MTTFRFPGGGLGYSATDETATVMVNGRKVRFDFSERFGPWVERHGRFYQPGPSNHAFWGAFNDWLAEWCKTHPQTRPRLAAQFNRDPQP